MHVVHRAFGLVALGLACAAACDGGELTARCGDTVCEPGLGERCETCAEDCGACPPCGDALCEPELDESCATCPADCGACAVCGDGACAPVAESCESCSADCGDCGECGDGECRAAEGEDCASCAVDCGACEGCGDGACDAAAGEGCASCPADCGECDPCGDDLCDADETCELCPQDCGDCDPCGDLECQADQGETCDSCPADCGACAERAGCVQGDFEVYYGTFHAHTSFSDGEGRPAGAFDHAREQGLDFFYLTDHRRRLTATEWSTCRDRADERNVDGAFVAGCGYELNDDDYGHLCVLFTSTMMPLPSTLAEVWDGLVGCSPCVGQFNHPPRPNDFNDYRYVARAADAMRLMEFSGGAAFSEKWDSYLAALDNGWLISPSQNEDNHHETWGDSARATGVWAPTLTRRALRRAVRARRTFSTTDENASIRVMADDVCWMGSVLSGLGPTVVTVEASDSQAADGFDRINLYGPGGAALGAFPCAGANPCTATLHFEVTEATYVVARAVQESDGTLVSGPIWYVP